MPKPEVWGPPLWKKLHELTFEYPENPSGIEKKNMIQFFKVDLPKLIPCEECVINYRKKLQRYPIELSIDSKAELTRWLVDIHNQVNLDTGKPMIPVKDAIALYENETGKFDSNKVIILLIILIILFVFKCRS